MRTLHQGLALGTLVALVACTQSSPLFCETSADCSDPARPFCDSTGAFPASEGISNTCIADPLPDAGLPDAPVCDAGSFVDCADADSARYCNEDGTALVEVDCVAECSAADGGCFCEPSTSSCTGDVELRCDASGNASVESCALGCDDAGARCIDVAPSNGLGGFLDLTEEAPAVVLGDGAVIDTDTGVIEDGDGASVAVPSFELPAPAGGVAVRVFTVNSLELGDTIVTGSRGLAVVSDRDIVISGIVRLQAGRGPGGACDGGQGICSDTTCSGPGGGGFGRTGGRGGGASFDGSIIVGGPAGLDVGSEQLVPLRGGCSGGRAGTAAKANNGGGSAQFVSRTQIRLAEDSAAFLDAGGRGGTLLQGGGSGGGILLEAPDVFVPVGTGLVANGGGGGCNEANGGEAQRSSTAAPGALCSLAKSGDGGDGGVSSDGLPGESVSGSGTLRGGGGGAGPGRIRVNVPTPASFRDFGVVSPPPSVGVLATR